MIAFVVACLALVSSATAACSGSAVAVSSININQFPGTWYGIENNYESVKCIKAAYSLYNSTTLDISISTTANDGSVTTQTGYATPSTGSKWTGVLNLVLNGSARQNKILADTSNWFVIYRCLNGKDLFVTLSKTKSLTTSERAAVDAVYKKNGLSTSTLYKGSC